MSDEKKPKRPIGPFSFCPRHSVFFKSCGCKWERGAQKPKEGDDIDA